MSVLDSWFALWPLATIQFAGLASAFLARLSEGSRGQQSCQFLFFGCLLMVGAATMAAIVLGPTYWVASGITFAVMVLAATCDFRRLPSPRPAEL